MLNTIKLLLPALIPSWRFFDTIAPSPRIEFTLNENDDELSESWAEFRPRPERLPVVRMLRRLFWNPTWNETLFLVSCSERLMANATQHSQDEIYNRIKAQLLMDKKHFAYLQFRIVFVFREGDQLKKQIKYISPLFVAREGEAG